MNSRAGYFIGSMLAAFLLSGCVTPADPGVFFVLTPDDIKHKAFQTRSFETANEKELLSASAAVLQDLGFQIEESAVDVGIIRATKERGAREFGQELAQGLIAILSLFGQTILIIPVDLHQQIAATLATRPVEGDPSRFTVRIAFHRTVWKGEGHSGNQYIPPGQQRLEMIYDPKIYQQFFAKLNKSVFLEEHQI
ncbi:MAG: hypothetical protein ACU833_15490 [Gammaproteobacteria bacterium]